MRKWFRTRWVIVGSVGIGVAIGVSALQLHQYVQHNPQFCNTCHIMEGPYSQWSTSPHHLVNCHECHRQSTMDGIAQIWFFLTKRPKAVVHHPELDHTVCAKCHLSNDPQWKLVGETAGHKVHFSQAGIDCLDCHLDGVHEFVRPVERCGNCHTDKADMNHPNFLRCVQCHNFQATERGAEGIFPSREQCLVCHAKITTAPKDQVHDPSAQESCVSCHSLHVR